MSNEPHLHQHLRGPICVVMDQKLNVGPSEWFFNTSVSFLLHFLRFLPSLPYLFLSQSGPIKSNSGGLGKHCKLLRGPRHTTVDKRFCCGFRVKNRCVCNDLLNTVQCNIFKYPICCCSFTLTLFFPVKMPHAGVRRSNSSHASQSAMHPPLFALEHNSTNCFAPVNRSLLGMRDKITR